METWIYELIKEDLKSLSYKYGGTYRDVDIFKPWPVIGRIDGINPEFNALLQTKIDIVFSLGGDGTLLSLLRSLFNNYSKIDLPKIAAFNCVSISNVIFDLSFD